MYHHSKASNRGRKMFALLPREPQSQPEVWFPKSDKEDAVATCKEHFLYIAIDSVTQQIFTHTNTHTHTHTHTHTQSTCVSVQKQ